eukprot:TRINITY_DN6947_c0_g1_i2.p1 TRINITY_DN6947_c0_g1~~TRINITY_DN6947_c0_g1_i2.p1  ORF type:complete len:142 (-),score=3.75 TRINITY_DN6947_c0_g1_i2:2-427(-)
MLKLISLSSLFICLFCPCMCMHPDQPIVIYLNNSNEDIHINLDEILAKDNLLSSRSGDCHSEGKKLMNLVNRYRRSMGLASIPVNNCLCKTANAHTIELNSGQAWVHSWKDCAYNAWNYQCKWNKPKQSVDIVVGGKAHRG